MSTSARSKGFSLVELLLVLAIIGIISGIAIPSFLGQRRRARVIGDAQSNARVLAMALESRRADNGTYGTSASTYVWTASGGRPTTDIAPSFVPKGASQMNFSVLIGTNGLAYTLTITDPTVGSATVLTADETGAMTLDSVFNK
jgi:prepilin-type N-terminal cleavage/methylation domain-containing protein